MAKKFFYNKVYNPKKTRIIAITIAVIAIIGIVFCVLLIKRLTKGALYTCDNPIISIKDSISLDINAAFPEKTAYFSELQCVNEKYIKVNTRKVKISEVGNYEVTVKVADESYTVKVEIVDNTAPKLKLKDVSITYGDSYQAKDFIESCTDNSAKECQVDFYQLATDEDGEKITYSNYTEVGKYEVKIIAKDESNNQAISSARLEIKEKTVEPAPVPEPDTNPDPIPTNPDPEPTCEYGDLSYNTEYIIAAFAGVNNCAISKEAIKKDDVIEHITAIADTETRKIKSDISKLSGISTTLYIDRNITGIINTAGTGYVGFSLEISVTDDKGNVIVDYFLKENSTRAYRNNPYNLP